MGIIIKVGESEPYELKDGSHLKYRCICGVKFGTKSILDSHIAILNEMKKGEHRDITDSE